MEKMFNCKRCGREIKKDVPHCIYCLHKLRKAGMCVVCGKRPRRNKQAWKCEECKDKASFKIEDEPTIERTNTRAWARGISVRQPSQHQMHEDDYSEEAQP